MPRGTTTMVVSAMIAILASSAVAGDPRDGRALYLRYCAACHGSDARGHGRVAEALAKPPSDLTAIAARRGGVYPASDMAAFIDGRRDVRAHGGSDMPVWGTLLRQELDDQADPERSAVGVVQAIVEYLGTIQSQAK